jgi:molecular chaperone GrpE
MAKNNPQDPKIDPQNNPQDDVNGDDTREAIQDEQDELGFKLTELTMDLQRTRADFENYRKRVDSEKQAAREAGQANAILKLLPVIDNIERAMGHMPDDLADNAWAQSVAGLVKHLEKSLDGLNLKRIDANPGTAFNPELHEAIQFDEGAEGEHEVIAEELQAGYTLNGHPIRHAMVKVTRQ